MFTTLTAVLLLSFLIAMHELGHFFAAKRAGVKVPEFGFGFPPRLLRVATIGGTDYTINMIPFGAFVRLAGETDPGEANGLQSKSKTTRFLVSVAGPATNLLLAILLFAGAFMAGWPSITAYKYVLITKVEPNSPAAEAALRVGDVVTAADGKELLGPEQMVTYTDSRRGQLMTLSVRRGAKTQEVRLTPRVSPPPGQGALGIGIYPAPEKVEVTRYSWYEALGKGLVEAWDTLKATVRIPAELLRGAVSPELARPVGPVGIVGLTGSAAQQGAQTGWWQPLLRLVAAISLALGFTNLLPLPALDGGKILFVLVEAVRRRRIDPAKENLVHWTGLVVLVLLMLFITYQDIVSPPPNIQLPSPF